MEKLIIKNGYAKYPAYEKSNVDWLGDIPVGWKVRKVKHLFKIAKEKSFEENPTILSLTMRGIKVRDISNNEGQLAESYLGYHKVRINDIILNPMDLKSGFIDCAKTEGVISPAYTTLRSIKPLVHDYYKYYFQWHYYDQILFPFGEGVSVDHRWTLKNEDLLNFPIIEPSADDQERIHKFLDDKFYLIDSIIKKKKVLIQSLQEKFLSIVGDVVTGRRIIASDLAFIQRDSSDYKSSGADWINEIPKKWDIVKLRYLAKTVKTGSTPPSSEMQYFKNELNWFTPGDFKEAELKNSKRKIARLAVSDNKCKQFDKYSVLLISIGATLGKTGYSENDFCCNQQINVITPNSKLYYKYLYYCLLIFNELVKSYSLFTTLAILNQERLKRIPCLVPALNEQVNLVKYLEIEFESTRLLIQDLERSINTMNEYKLSLIAQVTTGKIKV